MTINDSSGLKVQLLSDQLMTTEEIQTIKEALKQARFKYWNEKENRTELVAILSKNVEFGEFDQISMQKEHPIYRLLLDCKLKSEDILFHCNSLSLNEPLINWILQRFENLTEGYLWACENNHVEVIKFLLNESESRGININAKDENGNTGLGAYLRVNHLSSLHLLRLEPFYQVHHSVHNTGPGNIAKLIKINQKIHLKPFLSYQ